MQVRFASHLGRWSSSSMPGAAPRSGRPGRDAEPGDRRAHLSTAAWRVAPVVLPRAQASTKNARALRAEGHFRTAWTVRTILYASPDRALMMLANGDRGNIDIPPALDTPASVRRSESNGKRSCADSVQRVAADPVRGTCPRERRVLNVEVVLPIDCYRYGSKSDSGTNLHVLGKWPEIESYRILWLGNTTAASNQYRKHRSGSPHRFCRNTMSKHPTYILRNEPSILVHASLLGMSCRSCQPRRARTQIGLPGNISHGNLRCAITRRYNSRESILLAASERPLSTAVLTFGLPANPVESHGGTAASWSGPQPDLSVGRGVQP